MDWTDERGTRIVFTGDIAFSQYFGDRWENNDVFSGEVTAFLRDADVAVGNIEAPMTYGAFAQKRKLIHSSNPAVGAFLHSNNLRVWTLANNHALDCGVPGLVDTLRYAKQNDCETIGAGADPTSACKPAIIGATVKVGILSVAMPWERIRTEEGQPYVMQWDKEELIRRQIESLRREVRWIVLVVHAGNEFTNLPTPLVREKYHRFLDWGADIVVGHHPHVVQNYETAGNKVIFYSLGNFVFDTDYQRVYAHSDVGVLLGVNFYQDSFTWDTLPIRVNRERQTIEPSTCPAIFCGIDERNYHLLHPLECRRIPRIARIKQEVLHPDQIPRGVKGKCKALYLFLRKLKQKEQRVLYQNILLSWLGVWRCSPLKTVAAYIREDKSALKKPDEEFAIQEHGARYP